MAKKRHHKPVRHISNSTPNESLNYFPTPPNPTNIDIITTNWLLSGCKCPRTLSSDASSHSLRADVDAGAADVDGMTYSYGPTEESPRLTDLSPGSVRASARFFVAPAATGSLIEEARLSGARAAEEVLATSSGSTPAELVMHRDKSLNEQVRGELPMEDGRNKVYESFSDAAAAAVVAPRVAVRCGGVAAVEYSDDPCADFRASMMEMVGAACHVGSGGPLDDYWGFMEELLFCYLALNERSVYKYIFRAFADVAKNRSPQHRRLIPVDDVD